MKRRHFLQLSSFAGMGCLFDAAGMPDLYPVLQENYLMTVNGKLPVATAGIFLSHEHITTDFAGAEKVKQPQYNREDAFMLILPYLHSIKKQGVSVLVECTPNYLGRDVLLLARLSRASGIHILTNTGYYAAVDEKYLPKHFYIETETQIANRWLQEWENGIDGSAIRPGFIKLGVGKGPLKETEHKLIRAAAYTHLHSGLKIAIHSGDGAAALEEQKILWQEGVAPDALIVIHAQNDRDGQAQVELASKGCWISLDGIKDTTAAIPPYIVFLQRLKKEKLLNRVLISHDDGWGVNKKENGSITLDLFGDKTAQPYSGIFSRLKPELLKAGFTETDFDIIMRINPADAFAIDICKR